MILTFYSLAIRLMNAFMHLASGSNSKAKLWVKGRKHWKSNYQFLKEKKQSRVWVHCASVGEFEQARPVIELIKQESPKTEIHLTFFSPSGYELRKTYELADSVLYLPVDTHSNARSFLDLLQPDVVVFIKYEFWFNYMNECCKRSIPIAFASAYLPNGHWLLGGIGKYFQEFLCGINHYFVQDKGTQNLLESVGVPSSVITVNGDTRVDRVVKNAQVEWSENSIEQFVSQSKVLVVGSNWPSDDQRILSALEAITDLKVIVAPHEMKPAQLNKWKEVFGSQLIKYSEINEMAKAGLVDAKVLYIDTIGLLSKIYRYADVAYVGGGFGAAVHNTLEPAVYRIPVLFGPKNQRFLEIQKLKSIGAGIEIHSAEDFRLELDSLMNDQVRREEIKLKLDGFFENQQGASFDVANWVLTQLNDSLET